MELKKIRRLNNEEKAYLAGFLDGDGCILTQLVKSSEYKYGYTVRVSVVFYQKITRHWFLIQLQKKLGGNLRKKNDGMSELTITGFKPVHNLLITLRPFLRIKKQLALLVLEIIEEYKSTKTEADFLKVCKKIDKIANLTYSKKRKHTYSSVISFLNSPVETENK
jgi:intein/homing endonuclease